MDGPHSSHISKRRRNQDPDVQLSKLLSYSLRHGANELGLPMGSDGFVPVSFLLPLHQFRSFSQSDIERVVSCNDKQRFTIRTSEPGGTLEIRANQGHSIEVEVELTPLGAELPPQAIHGTYLCHWPSILRCGLSRVNRTHIHLSTQLPGEGEGVISDHLLREKEISICLMSVDVCKSTLIEPVTSGGMRRDCEVAIFIDLPKAIADQIPFFWSANRVLLTPGNADGVLLPKYFVKVLQLRPHRKLLDLE